MSKSCNAGELRTPVIFVREQHIDKDGKYMTDDDGYPITSVVNVLGKSNGGNLTFPLNIPQGGFTFSNRSYDLDKMAVKVKWVNAHGTDAYTSMQLQLREPATITCRYSPSITPDCIIYKAKDPNPYEIISIDNVEERSRWLEIKVQRKVASR